MRQIIIGFIFLVFAWAADAQKVFTIWPDTAEGTENWKWHEKEDSLNKPSDPVVYNVAQPTLTFFPADPRQANGTSVIICPGGSFCYLHINTEGIDLAKWLNKKGISAFVLKYRLVHSETDNPMKEKNERMKDPVNSTKFAIADGKQAITYVRKHASEFFVAPDKIGIIGFSAGGTIAAASVFDYTSENRPDFAAPIYAYIPPSLPMNVLKDAPPIFIAAATDDELHLVPMSINLYSKWLAEGHSAEIHIYSKGGHGFGMNKKDQPSDNWVDRFVEWLQVQGLVKK